ncbi:MAG: amino acid ABC transporter permease [Actinomycetota bacterium]
MLDWLTADIAGEMARGVAVTIVLTIVTSISSFLVGLTAAIARRSRRNWLRPIATAFVEIFRNVPALILIIFFAFAVPNLFPAGLRGTLFFDNPLVDLLGAITTLTLPYYALAAAVALTLNTGAHLAEVIRPGLDAVPAARIDAARSLGASARTAYFTVTIPDGLRIGFPGIINRLVHNLKNTALVSFVAVPDAYQEIQAAITETFRATELLVFAAVLYLALATVLEFGLRRIERALWRGRPIDRMVDV